MVSFFENMTLMPIFLDFPCLYDDINWSSNFVLTSDLELY